MALYEYKAKARPNQTMQMVATALGDAEIAALAAYLAQLPRQPNNQLEKLEELMTVSLNRRQFGAFAASLAAGLAGAPRARPGKAEGGGHRRWRRRRHGRPLHRARRQGRHRRDAGRAAEGVSQPASTPTSMSAVSAPSKSLEFGYDASPRPA